VAARLIEFKRGNLVIDHLQPPIRRNDIDVIGFEVLSRGDFDDWHAGARSDDVNEFAAVFGIEVHDYDKGGASIVWQRGEQGHQSLNAACGRADSDNDWQLIVIFIDGLWLVVLVRHNGTFFASPTEQQHIRERANRASAFLALRGSDAPLKKAAWDLTRRDRCQQGQMPHRICGEPG
jgi:hypothetical protein